MVVPVQEGMYIEWIQDRNISSRMTSLDIGSCCPFSARSMISRSLSLSSKLRPVSCRIPFWTAGEAWADRDRLTAVVLHRLVAILENILSVRLQLQAVFAKVLRPSGLWSLTDAKCATHSLGFRTRTGDSRRCYVASQHWPLAAGQTHLRPAVAVGPVAAPSPCAGARALASYFLNSTSSPETDRGPMQEDLILLPF